jgi:hypothetical protein
MASRLKDQHDLLQQRIRESRRFGRSRDKDEPEEQKKPAGGAGG